MLNMNMNMPIQNIGFQNMMNNNINFNDNKWSLLFEHIDNEKKIIEVKIFVSPNETIQDVINRYKSKIGEEDEIKLIFNGKQLHPKLKISESGLSNNSRILAMRPNYVYGG